MVLCSSKNVQWCLFVTRVEVHMRESRKIFDKR